MSGCRRKKQEIKRKRVQKISLSKVGRYIEYICGAAAAIVRGIRVHSSFVDWTVPELSQHSDGIFLPFVRLLSTIFASQVYYKPESTGDRQGRETKRGSGLFRVRRKRIKYCCTDIAQEVAFPSENGLARGFLNSNGNHRSKRLSSPPLYLLFPSIQG